MTPDEEPLTPSQMRFAAELHAFLALSLEEQTIALKVMRAMQRAHAATFVAEPAPADVRADVAAMGTLEFLALLPDAERERLLATYRRAFASSASIARSQPPVAAISAGVVRPRDESGV